MFIKIMTCYALHRSKGIHHYYKVLIVYCSCYHGYRKKEQSNSSVSKGFRLWRLYRGVQLYPHGRTRLTSIPHAWDKGCLTSPNLSLIWPKCLMKGLGGCSINVLDILDRRNPLASFTDKLVATSYLACQPHRRHVVCTGGYSDSRIPINGP